MKGQMNKGGMSESGQNDWQKLWQQYTESFENWSKMLESIQKASTEMQDNFTKVWEKATTESSADTMKLFGENWQKAMEQMGTDAFKHFNESWQKAMRDATAESFKKFGEEWQKNLSNPGMEQMKAYGDMMKKFAETWDTMWPQKSKKVEVE